VAEFLQNGDKSLSNFYHIVKTHKIPPCIENPVDWIDQEGLPVRGIISARRSPTERLAGFVDFFLQKGMQNLPSFLRDTKHTLQVIEDINDQIEKGEVSLDGVALVSLDVVSMYTNMTEEIGTSASKDYLQSRLTQGVIPDELKVKTKSILSALELCIRNIFFKFNSKISQTRN
jgi:hypothetical protein